VEQSRPVLPSGVQRAGEEACQAMPPGRLSVQLLDHLVCSLEQPTTDGQARGLGGRRLMTHLERLAFINAADLRGFGALEILSTVDGGAAFLHVREVFHKP